MDLIKLQEWLLKIQRQVEEITMEGEPSVQKMLTVTSELIGELKQIVEPVLQLIGAVETGEEQYFLGIVNDLCTAYEQQDEVLLYNTLRYGLAEFAGYYAMIIRKALEDTEDE